MSKQNISLAEQLLKAGVIESDEDTCPNNHQALFLRTINNVSFSRYGKFTDITVTSYSLDKHASME